MPQSQRTCTAASPLQADPLKCDSPTLIEKNDILSQSQHRHNKKFNCGMTLVKNYQMMLNNPTFVQRQSFQNWISLSNKLDH